MAVFRTLLPSEAGRYRDHLLRLSPADRRARFFASMSDEAIARHVDRISWNRTIVLVAIQQGVVRAAAELRLGDRSGEAAELAFSVEEALQGQGMGTNLTRRILTAARNRSVRRVYMICQSDNRRMQRIAANLIGPCRFEDGDVISAADLAPATALTLAQEFIDCGAAPMATILDQWQRPQNAAA